jgi:hypothetical protein
MITTGSTVSLKMGIPDSVMASGGVYTHRDGRDVPDVLNITMEYPDFTTGTTQKNGKEKGMTFLYTATLGNSYWRPTKLMGHDATLELGNQLTVYPDAFSTRYKDLLESETVETGTPILFLRSEPEGGRCGHFCNGQVLFTKGIALHLPRWEKSGQYPPAHSRVDQRHPQRYARELRHSGRL